MTRTPLQRRRAWFQVGFFSLFVLAPPLDILRIDLTLGHAILLGQPWTLGIEDFLAGRTGVWDAVLNLLLRGFLPIFGGGALFLWVAWRFGRLYCGWLCPHFSVVELINGLMRRASGKPSVWEPRPLPPPLGMEPRARPTAATGLDHTGRSPRTYWNPWYWLPTLLAVGGFAFLWALVFLTYLLPPFEIYHNLLTGTLTRNQTLFLSVATLALSVEFLLARHFFCRYACAVGLFQSLVWMANDRAMVVGFDTTRADACNRCGDACNHACPMRLKPRTLKRKMFTCTECAECIAACTQVQQGDPARSLLRWVADESALPVVTGRPSRRVCGTPPRAAATPLPLPGGH
ncbi:4Fe-4S binding protein [Thiocystis violacea]|uniref:4Fe-4S binding protein n=1 Tax=Thiocystis violacea TaxID=13725 RepID=UPI0019049BCB|nr:4Fe-4S binding protein [Thiocystis violacea]MBK1717352.1 4Fe-4S binding protein [Thiocystis violacea]